MTFAMGGAPSPGSDRIPVELFQILKDDAVESAALNMQYAGSRQSHPYMNTGKTIALTRRIFVGKVMSLLYNMLPRFVIAFLPRSKQVSLNFMVAVIIFSDFGAQEDEICHYFYCITIYFP